MFSTGSGDPFSTRLVIVPTSKMLGLRLLPQVVSKLTSRAPDPAESGT